MTTISVQDFRSGHSGQIDEFPKQVGYAKNCTFRNRSKTIFQRKLPRFQKRPEPIFRLFLADGRPIARLGVGWQCFIRKELHSEAVSHAPSPSGAGGGLASEASQRGGLDHVYQRSGRTSGFGLMDRSHAPPPASPTPPAGAGGEFAKQAREGALIMFISEAAVRLVLVLWTDLTPLPRLRRPLPLARAGSLRSKPGRGLDSCLSAKRRYVWFWSYGQILRPSPGFADPSRWRAAGSLRSKPGGGLDHGYQRSGGTSGFGLMDRSHAPPPAVPTPPAGAGGETKFFSLLCLGDW